MFLNTCHVWFKHVYGRLKYGAVIHLLWSIKIFNYKIEHLEFDNFHFDLMSKIPLNLTDRAKRLSSSSDLLPEPFLELFFL